jgi:hypothetical protein
VGWFAEVFFVPLFLLASAGSRTPRTHSYTSQMELSEEIVQGLSALKDSKRVSDASFAALVAVSCDIVARKKTEDDLKSM